jgi:hypothetical protein
MQFCTVCAVGKPDSSFGDALSAMSRSLSTSVELESLRHADLDKSKAGQFSFMHRSVAIATLPGVGVSYT